MIKLNAKDIVKRATQLADLENSDFISWNENVQLLNEAYQKIYQKVINHDDKTYLKKLNLINGIGAGGNEIHYELPNDFYQLYSLNDVHSGKCVVKKSINEPINSLRYDIINNELVIYGNNSLILQMSYFPAPKTITLKADTIEFELPSVFLNCNLLDVYNKTVVGHKKETAQSSTIYIYDIDTETLSTYIYNRPTEISDIIRVIATNIGILIATETQAIYLLKYSNPTTEYSKLYSKNIFIDNKKNVFIYDKNTGMIKMVIDKLDNAVGVIGKSELFKDIYNFFGYIDTDNKTITGYKKDELNILTAKYDDTEFTDTGLKMPSQAGYVIDDFIYDSKVLYDTNMTTIDIGVIGVNKIDDNTGYGYTTLDGKVKGCFFDTELTYPNNLFIQLISYYMAIQYKSKQNAECSGLISLYQETEEQFYDSISRDDYQYTRIQNVY